MKRWPYILLASLWTAILLMPLSGFSAGDLFLTLGTTPTPTPTATVTPTATPTPTPTATPTPVDEPLASVGGIGETTGFYLPNFPGTYGQTTLACRTGWRWIWPKATSVAAPVWASIDNCGAAALAVGTTWSLSLSAGAYSPLWMFKSTGTYPCSATPQTGYDGPGAGGTLQAFSFAWPPTYVYTKGSTQCIPIPWDPAYQAAWLSFIHTVFTHIAGLPSSSLLTQVKITGMNEYSQENSLPGCTVYSTGSTPCGVNTGVTGVDDTTLWIATLNAELADGTIPGGGTCTGTSRTSTCGVLFNSVAQSSYATLITDWSSVFTGLLYTSMYVDSSISFPFQSTYPSYTGLEILNQMPATLGASGVVMNNAIGTTSPYINNKIACFSGHAFTPANCQPPPATPQPTASIAFQQGQASTSGASCTTAQRTAIVNMLSAAQSALSLFSEIYTQDLHCLAGS